MGKLTSTGSRIWVVTFLLIFTCSVSAAFAQGNLKLGRLTVTPALKYELRYDDNIFLESTNTQDDIINLISPGLLFGYAGSRDTNYFQAGYNGTWAFYNDFSKNDWQRHSPFITAGYGTHGFYVKFADNWTYSEDPYGSFNQFDQSNRFGIGVKTKRADNLLDLTLGYNLTSQYFIEGDYQNYRIDYDAQENQWQDRTDNAAALALFYRITGKTALLAQYRYLQADYTEQEDGIYDPGRDTNWSSDTSQNNKEHQVLVGARFEPGGKLTGEAKVGWGTKDFDNNTDPVGFAYEDWSGLVFSAISTYQPLPRTSLFFNFQRAPFGSPDAQSSMFVNTLFQVKVQQAMAYRFSLNGAFSYNWDDYQNVAAGLPSKSFTRPEITVGADWLWKPWLAIGAYYQYQNNIASNDLYKTSEYTDNRVALFITGSY